MDYMWTVTVTNREVLNHIKLSASLQAQIARICLIYIGHVMCVKSLEKATVLGIVSGTRRRGRQRMCWLHTKQDEGPQLKEAILNGVAWRALIYKVTKRQT